MRKRFLKKKYILIIIVLILIGLVVMSIRANSGTIEVREAELTTKKIVQSVSGSGEITSVNEADLSFAGGGKLTNVAVEEGQKVAPGTLLAQLYNYDAYSTSKAAKDARDIALRDKDLYVEAYENDPDTIDEDTHQLNLRRHDELISKAEATYQQSLGSLTDSYIYAPFAGTVVDVLFVEGETVGVGSPVIKMADIDNLLFEISIDQEDFGLVQIGQSVEVTIDAYDSEVFSGSVYSLPIYANSVTTQDFVIQIQVASNENKPLLLGMTGDASIIIAETEDEATGLQFDSIFYDEDDRPFVWVMSEDGTLAKVYVDVGLEGDIYTQVRDLPATLNGAKIVVPVSVDANLKEGAKARLVEQ